MLIRGKPDAAATAPDAGLAPAVDAAPPDAPPLDAPSLVAAPIDAALAISHPVDAATRPAAVDAPPRSAPVDAPPSARSGTLKVGANPWGEVYLDGRRLGRAPNAWEVPAGKHTIEVVFPSDEGEVRRRFDVDVPVGGTNDPPIFADFTP
jgi:hypothetical protein